MKISFITSSNKYKDANSSIFFQMFGSTLIKGRTEIYIQSQEKFHGSLLGLIWEVALSSVFITCAFQNGLQSTNNHANMLKQKRSYIKQNLYRMADEGTGYQVKCAVKSVLLKNFKLYQKILLYLLEKLMIKKLCKQWQKLLLQDQNIV